MKKEDKAVKIINSVSEIHRILSLPKPRNPLITLIRHEDVVPVSGNGQQPLVLNFYDISIKRSFKGQMKYGRKEYDFDEGTLSFVAPNQVISIDQDDARNRDGWSLLFHPDLIRNYPLGTSIKKYGFFSYEVNEALHLSSQEEELVESLVKNIEREYESGIDLYSADVTVSNIELLLNYSNRFYNRQFITRKMASSDLLIRFEQMLAKQFEDDTALTLPTVNSLAAGLHLSPGYLSDMLRTLTGQNTQQHIHNKVIEKAKAILTSTQLSVSEIAFQLGFEFPQSFSKLFKNKTDMTPLEFRNSFN